jgi:hypothetical protein
MSDQPYRFRDMVGSRFDLLPMRPAGRWNDAVHLKVFHHLAVVVPAMTHMYTASESGAATAFQFCSTDCFSANDSTALCPVAKRYQRD